MLFLDFYEFCKVGLSYIKEAGKKGKLGLWHITEPVDELLKMKTFSAKDLYQLNSFSYTHRKKEWLVARILTEQLSGEKNTRIVYDKHNKPFLKNSNNHISLSHSHNLLAVIIDDKETGIDIELIKPNVLKIKEKFMSKKELSEAGHANTAEKFTLYWCVKESLYKYYGKKKLTFKENLLVEPFEYSEKGVVRTEIFHDSMKKKFELNYEKISAEGQEYMMAYIIKEV